ncbi:DNA-3-methyladenine glycosylase family protein [Rubripirellula reticaptiva]|uniref:DNA-3-methyladenine glycosylase II n=1 Tax=Rubripirellula reticaptiva TaxID=2528013 RepID=A0A5C6F8E7_9BACT|nr:DNA-3-methyladenine glycosylase [Rubripirellula reticaptiva]TWU58023.1 DNA-3-methyladenine glycosylase [Rubripirellula reticaptiva]
MCVNKLTRESIRTVATELARRDPVLASVLDQHGPPPLWKRPATLSTLVRIILEQQVSLASAKATFDRLVVACEGEVTEGSLVNLGQSQLADLGFTRQKARYTFTLAQDVAEGRFNVSSLARKSDDQVRTEITARLGMGHWTADVFLMMALLRPDLLPTGDLALVKGLQELDETTYPTSQSLIQRAMIWRPYRSVATRMVWQSYLARRGRRLL